MSSLWGNKRVADRLEESQRVKTMWQSEIQGSTHTKQEGKQTLTGCGKLTV